MFKGCGITLSYQVRGVLTHTQKQTYRNSINNLLESFFHKVFLSHSISLKPTLLDTNSEDDQILESQFFILISLAVCID